MKFAQKLVMLLVCAGALCAAPAPSAMPLQFDRLATALNLLSDGDRRIVSEAVQLIREGEHTGALARLTVLTDRNPENSSVRILIAYAQLQLGNLRGAFDEATKAESSPNGNSYKCYFRAKLALLTGDKVTCQRELEHLKGVGDKDGAKQIAAELKRKKR